MRAYGAPRTKDREYPDVVDIQRHGMPSHAGRLREKCGVFKSYIRKVAKKARTRRYWKRKARQEAKDELKQFNPED